MTTQNKTTRVEMTYRNLLQSIKSDVIKAGFKTHSNMSIKTCKKNGGKIEYACQFTTTNKQNDTLFTWADNILANGKDDARYQAWKIVLGKLNIAGGAK